MNRAGLWLHALIAFTILMGIFIVGSCDSDNSSGSKPEPDPMLAALVSCSDCLDLSMSTSNSDECFEYTYESSGVLTILHHNAAFNCCPDSIYADIAIDGQTITFNEHEELSMPCHCLCPYDIEYRIENVAPGTYTLIFNDSYINDGDSILSGSINLGSNPNGSHCRERGYYPWLEPITASLVNYSDCLNHIYAAGNSEECCEYSYDGFGVLTLRHHNSAFNCCPDSIYTVIDIEEQTITFHEHERITIPCECLCLYDIDYRLENLPAGMYTLLFDGPYAEPKLTGTIDLGVVPNGSFCLERGFYPWPNPTAGYLLDVSECQANDGAQLSMTCIDYDYDGIATLHLSHINAWYNCCLDSISVAFTFNNDSIVIDEAEWLNNGGCDCTCPVNIDMRIDDLPPGLYTLVIGSASVDPAARHSVVLELDHRINSDYCWPN